MKTCPIHISVHRKYLYTRKYAEMSCENFVPVTTSVAVREVWLRENLTQNKSLPDTCFHDHLL